jgi:hypothetical protein
MPARFANIRSRNLASKRLLFAVLRKQLENGEIDSLEEIVAIIKPTNLALATGRNYNTIVKTLADPEKFTLHDLRMIGKLLEVHPRLLVELIFRKWEGE